MARRRELPLDMLALDRGSTMPLYRQLYESLRSHILDGRLAPRMRLPATRELAGDLNVSRNTVIGAYDALLAEGYLESVAGSGTRVAALPQFPRPHPVEPRAMPCRGCRSGAKLMTTLERIAPSPTRSPSIPAIPRSRPSPFRSGRSSSRPICATSARTCSAIISSPATRGCGTALAEYLAVSRGVKCDPEQVIVVAGAQAALDLIGRTFMDPGDHFWIEDPGYGGAWNAFLSAGGRPAPLPVGPGGWDIETANPAAATDLRHPVLPVAARAGHADGGPAEAPADRRKARQLDHRGRL